MRRGAASLNAFAPRGVLGRCYHEQDGSYIQHWFCIRRPGPGVRCLRLLVRVSTWLLLSAGTRSWLGRSEKLGSRDWPAALWSGFFIVTLAKN